MQSTDGPHNYQKTLQRIFLERIQRNPRYTLRSFARDLAVTPSQISLVLNRKKGLSGAQAERIAKALNLSKKETEIFCLQVNIAHGRSKAFKSQATLRLEQLLPTPQEQQLSEAELEFCTEWYVLATFELLKLKQPPQTLDEISEQLGIHSQEAKSATQVLSKLGLIEVLESGWKCTAKILTSSSEIPSLAIKNFHSQLYKKADQKLFELPIDKRHALSMLFPFEESRISEIKSYLDRIVGRFTTKFAQKEKADQVGTLMVHFFPLTKTQGTKTKTTEKK